MPPYVIDLLWFAAVLILVALNGCFVAAEFALVTVRWTRVEELVQKGRFGAKAVNQATSNLSDAIAACQLGITFASLALGWVGEPTLAHMIEPFVPERAPALGGNPRSRHGSRARLPVAHLSPRGARGAGAQGGGATARGGRGAPGVGTAAHLRARVPSLHPLHRGIQQPRGAPAAPSPQPSEQLVHSVDELQQLVQETQEAGIIPEDQARYVRNVFELSDKTVRDLMVARERVVTLSLDASEEAVLEIVRDTAHTRMPVWEGTRDNIVGVVNTKDLFHLFSLKGLVILMDAMYPPLFVSPDLAVARLLRIFRRERRPLAVVRDAEGTFLGIVTLEDILEEIVGEIEDEHDVDMPHGAVGVEDGPSPS